MRGQFPQFEKSSPSPRRTYSPTVILKPPTTTHGVPKNPDDIQALRTYQRYQRYILRGRSEEEATSLALREKGVCSRVLPSGETCGRPSMTKKGHTCGECKRLDYMERARRQRERGYHRSHKGVCQVCQAEFTGSKERVNCDVHTQVRVKPRKDKGRRHLGYGMKLAADPPEKLRETPRIVEPAKKVVLPDTWDTPLPTHLKLYSKPEPVKVPEGFQVTKEKAIFPTGLRDLFGSGRSAAD